MLDFFFKTVARNAMEGGSNTETTKSTNAMIDPQGKIKDPQDTSPQSYPRIAP